MTSHITAAIQRAAIFEIESIATTVQSLANALILLSSYGGEDPRFNGAVEEIAQIVEGKADLMLRLTETLSIENRKISDS